MIMALRGLLIAGGGLLLFLGAGFLMDPVGSGADFGLVVETTHGITSTRADFTGYFVIGAGCLMWGAIARRRDPLVIGGALMLVTLAVRVVSLSIDGPFDGFVLPMIVEAVIGTLALVGAQVLPAKD